MTENYDLPMDIKPVEKPKEKPLNVSRREILRALDKLEREDLRSDVNKGWYSVEMISNVVGKRVTKAKMRWLVTEGYVTGISSDAMNMNAGKFRLGTIGKQAVSGRKPMPKG